MFSVEWTPGKLQIPYREAHLSKNVLLIILNSVLLLMFKLIIIVISSFPATDKQLVTFANETKNDPMLHAVMKCILYG